MPPDGQIRNCRGEGENQINKMSTQGERGLVASPADRRNLKQEELKLNIAEILAEIGKDIKDIKDAKKLDNKFDKMEEKNDRSVAELRGQLGEARIKTQALEETVKKPTERR